VLAAAALHGGVEPDLLGEAAWWQADDFWQYAMVAAVGYIRAAAERAAYRCPMYARNCPGHDLPDSDEYKDPGLSRSALVAVPACGDADLFVGDLVHEAVLVGDAP
jgi:hypothetical protein